MAVNRERNYTFEEVRDKYLYIVYRIHACYHLDEDALADLTIAYCECIQRNLNKEHSSWHSVLSSAVICCAERVVSEDASHKGIELVPLEAAVDIESYDLEDVENSVLVEQLRGALDSVLSDLDPVEEKVLRLRYMYDKTLAECGDIINRCRERVRQHEVRALRRLRHQSRSVHLKPFLIFGWKPRRRVTEQCVSNRGDHFTYRAPYELGSKQWGQKGKRFELSVFKWQGYVISLTVKSITHYLDGTHLCVGDLSSATRYKTLDAAINAASILLSLDTYLVDDKLIMPQPLVDLSFGHAPKYGVCRILGSREFVIRCDYCGSLLYLNSDHTEWVELLDAGRYSNPSVAEGIIRQARDKVNGYTFPTPIYRFVLHELHLGVVDRYVHPNDYLTVLCNGTQSTSGI